MNKDNNILAFCHIIKCSGTTLSSILRRNYGINQLSALPKPNCDIYGEEEFNRDMKIFPFTKSITGHCLRPYIYYGSRDKDLLWFTWLRDPLSRLISGYQHSIEKGGRSISFEDWLQEPLHKNLQVFFLTGSETDLQGAKDVIAEKMKFVGLVERFDESLILFKDIFGLDGLNIDYPHISNAAKKGKIATDIYSTIGKYTDLIEYNISLDKQLYKWFIEKIYPGYVNNFGETRLVGEVRDAFPRAQIPTTERVCEFSNNFLRRFIYKPIIRRL